METEMRMIVLLFSLVALALPSEAAPRSKAGDDEALAAKCREMVGKEVGEGEGKSGIMRAQVQRWDDCMMHGGPH